MSKIEWCDVTWNPITGCTPISEGCQNCYAKRMANRLRGRFGYPQDDPFKITLHPSQLSTPFRWSKKRKKIFVCSMGDFYHHDVSGERRDIVYKKTRSIYPYHKFIFLTKRPENIGYSSIDYEWCVNNSWPDNIWLGVTAENQKRADERIPILLQIPAAVRFVSVEPMLGPVDIKKYFKPIHTDPVDCQFITSKEDWCGCVGTDWVIAGPETGPKTRLCKPEWIEDLYEQCKAVGVPFFDKRKENWLAREFPCQT